MVQGHSIWKKGIRIIALTDIGLRRANNQDSYSFHQSQSARQWLERGHLAVVADGMGAHAAGEVASRIAVDTVTKTYLRRSSEAPHQALANAIYEAHRLIRDKSRAEDAYRDMGTTCSALTLLPEGAVIAHVGDSRVYRIRQQMLEQLTFDHSLVWEVCLATNLPVDKPPSHIPKNQITRSLGPTEKLVVDVEGPFQIQPGDIFLLCSDGLSGQIADAEIGMLVSLLPIESAAEALINLANLRGGPDNITVVIAQTTQNDVVAHEVDEELTVPVSSWGILAASIGFLAGLGWAVASASYFFAGLFGIASLGGISWFFAKAGRQFFFPTSFVPTRVPFGKAPYITVNSVPTPEFAVNLAKTYHELCAAVQTNNLKVHSAEAEQSERRASEAATKQDFANAIREFALAINYTMREIKKLKG